MISLMADTHMVRAYLYLGGSLVLTPGVQVITWFIVKKDDFLYLPPGPTFSEFVQCTDDAGLCCYREYSQLTTPTTLHMDGLGGTLTHFDIELHENRKKAVKNGFWKFLHLNSKSACKIPTR